MWTRAQVAKAIDHAVLKPHATRQDTLQAAKMCIERGVGNLCVRPSDAAVAAKALKGSQTTLAVVVGFPHGSNRPEVKALEAKLAIQDGAQELDMVMNIGAFVSGELDAVRKDIEAVVAVAKPHKVLVKVILEVCWLSPEQIAQACKIAESAGADFVKTSTGFGDGPATPEAVDVMIRTVGRTMGVKAAGGVRSYETACGYLDQGCKRLGAAATEKILDEAPE